MGMRQCVVDTTVLEEARDLLTTIDTSVIRLRELGINIEMPNVVIADEGISGKIEIKWINTSNPESLC